jgi:RimJ/RimL family protein N-acetyltransferase
MPAFRDHLIRLDPESRYARFAMAVSDDFLIEYAKRSFGINDLVYGYFADGKMRAAGELRSFDSPHSGKRRAEAAFSVEKPFQRDGIGSELVRRIVRAAHNRRISTLYMTCLAQNRAMQSLARKFSPELQFTADTCDAYLDVPAPTPISWWSEAMADSASFTTIAFDPQTRLFAATPARTG